MKAVKSSLHGALDRPNQETRFYLFHGPDESQSRALAARLLAATGAAKHPIAASSAKSDPALIADEAAAMSLFGGPRLIWIEPAGDDIAESVAALLAAEAVESRTVAIAGSLRKSSALLRLAEEHPLALAHASYVPEGRDLERVMTELAQAEGLRIAPDVASRLAAACGNDRAVAAQELAKLALYVGASPEAPVALDREALDAVGAGAVEGDFLKLADLALAGELREVAEELSCLSAGGAEAIPVIRSLQRRLLMLAPMRARVERGERPDAVMAALGKSLFWKDKPIVAKMLAKWDADGLARVAERAGALERQLMLSDAPSAESLGEELAAVARSAGRRR